MTSAAIAPEAGNVTSHAIKMLRKMPQFTLSFDRALPTPTTDPTLQCVVEIGRPILLATRTVSAAPISMHTPLL